MPADDDFKEEVDEMMTATRALSEREPLWEVVTAVLPIVAAEDADMSAAMFRARYADLFARLGLRADSDRDIALLTGGVETARWVVVASEVANVDPAEFWRGYITKMRLTC
ncbi:MAG: hypothetical protein WC054_00490 [Candidatus Nanopelagicales bacterium]